MDTQAFDWNSLPPPEAIAWPIYPDDSPARRDEESNEAFNEAAAREAFGDGCVDALMDKQKEFRGDWWMLAMLHRCIAHAEATDPQRNAWDRFAAFKNVAQELWRRDVRVHLEQANLTTAHLEHVDLFKAHLEHTHLHSANLQRANLSGAHLEHAALIWAHLEHANLCGAHLEHGALFGAHLEHADLSGAHLGHAVLLEAHLEHADLRWAHLEHADLGEAHLEHADLRETYLDHGNIRGATGVLLDGNHADRLRIEGNAPDPWSVLRRTYTGPRYALHLALTLAFLLPFAVSVSNLNAIDRAYTAIAGATPRPAYEPRVGNLPRAGPRAVARPRVDSMAHGELRELVERFDRHHAPTPAWWVLVGGLEAWYFAFLTAVVAAYNLLRLVVMLGAWRWLVLGAGNLSTAGVTALREAEERSRVTPSLADYYGPLHPVSAAYKRRVLGWTGEKDDDLQPPEHEPARAKRLWREWRWMASCWLRYDKAFPLMAIGLYRLHCIARVLFWLAVAAFVFRAAHWVLTATVPVPIDALL